MVMWGQPPPAVPSAACFVLILQLAEADFPITSCEAAQECSPRRKSWVSAQRARTSPGGAKENSLQVLPFLKPLAPRGSCVIFTDSKSAHLGSHVSEDNPH